MDSSSYQFNLQQLDCAENLELILTFFEQNCNVLRSSGKKAFQVLNVYLFGSRLFGVETPESDFDFVFVVSGEMFLGPKFCENKNINLSFYHVSFFEHLIKENIIWIVAFAFLPKSAALCGKKKSSFSLS
eukprot:TRINITY_DN6290_c0_g1_i1.p1 TRINITY_DN6290_c0_g1~~TRINITY_DN6290_c0_g1_i1.p1  ORF type:complete len:130 (+),score=37.34 TRINITY_DN6290_c0_g1_i1:234-623(+)